MKFFSKITISLCPLLCLSVSGISGCASAEEQPSNGGQAAVTEAQDVAEVQKAEPSALSEIAVAPEEEERPSLPVAPSYDRDDVKWIQQRLQELGYYDGAVDGAVGSATQSAVKAYQQDQGLAGDGRPTSELREFMWRNGG